jgi:hypothetical protein
MAVEGGGPGTLDSGVRRNDGCSPLIRTFIMILAQSIITLAYYALTAGAAALLLYNFVKARTWDREVLYLIVLVPFLLRLLHVK